MSELRDADAALEERQRNIATDGSLDPYRLLFMGMDLNADEVWTMSDEHAEAGIQWIADKIEEMKSAGEVPDVSLREVLQSVWLDGFSVAAMLFLRRAER